MLAFTYRMQGFSSQHEGNGMRK